MTKRIVDCFTFFNELELLELRLNELGDHVDAFVLVEATKTFKGSPKPLVFEQSRHLFSRFLYKIIHIVVDDMPDVADAWAREYHQRHAITRGLADLAPEDVVIVSDLDEIVRPDVIDLLRARSGYFKISMPMYQFFLNTRAISGGWDKVFAYSYRLHKALPDYSRIRVRQAETFAAFAGENFAIENGGWHFTFLGGAEAVRSKLAAYSHDGSHYGELQKPNQAEYQLELGYQLGRHDITDFVEIDGSFPSYVRANLDRFVRKGLVKTPIMRVRELERAFRTCEAERRRLEAQLEQAQRGSLVGT